MNRKRMVLSLIALGALGGFSSMVPGSVPPPLTLAAAPDTLPPGYLSVLTYNVGGLPWPVARDRPQALAAIGDRLAQMRATGAAPQVVVLQEAFTTDAEAIARRSGYGFVAFGPGAGMAQPALPGYAPARSIWKGETVGPQLSSGLVILSDYRLSDIRRQPFPKGACAGYDCLANKGMLSARVAVPDAPAPVEIIATHMNSAGPSGQPEIVSRAAYARQIDALDRFDDRPESHRTIRLFAGDFNMGHSPGRLELLMGYIKKRKAKVATAMGRDKYADGCRAMRSLCGAQFAMAANVPAQHANDWQFYAAPDMRMLAAVSREVMFKPDANGKTLSDHLGLKVTYRFQ
ncbi:endonuclease/exonuclease/phosphatase family metal-dependent hydrolase [Sphingobium sp. OAS761]|uniref:endonuclease/exonuclease/phosphatase family protein n=1 Tax=Sphingobium sp. OAS761 TaxID=2817901 RepID=UPI0020A018B5|nr:endonuclease/exonuclease/phosphatase family protein [Sphingobium sp. OAS761]MCP1468618.1 endonuclease/exonuclease/phosphatase family metal-dependent hydrolase [Sphingobium sp. OAS761]